MISSLRAIGPHASTKPVWMSRLRTMQSASTAGGLLIAIEGIDGAGTTTQARRLVEWLEASGRPAHLTREPSTGPIGELLRRMLGGAFAPVDAGAVALLFAADRLDHLAREV